MFNDGPGRSNRHTNKCAQFILPQTHFGATKVCVLLVFVRAAIEQSCSGSKNGNEVVDIQIEVQPAAFTHEFAELRNKKAKDNQLIEGADHVPLQERRGTVSVSLNAENVNDTRCSRNSLLFQHIEPQSGRKFKNKDAFRTADGEN